MNEVTVVCDTGVVAHRLALGDPRYPELGFVLDYWTRLRGPRFAPPRREIDPAGLKPVLPRITLVRVNADKTFCFGLAGTGLYALHNMEIAHKPVDDMRPPAYRDLLNAHYAEVVRTKAPNSYEIVFTTHDGLRRHYASLRVPLSDDGENVTGLLTVDNFGEGWKDLEPYFDWLYDRGKKSA